MISDEMWRWKGRFGEIQYVGEFEMEITVSTRAFDTEYSVRMYQKAWEYEERKNEKEK